MSIEASTFKAIMSHWASGIAVITTSEDGVLQGFTASSLASVSIDPLLVSFSISKTLMTGETLLRTQRFAVNILPESNLNAAKIFAGMLVEPAERFHHVGYEIGNNGSPLLTDVIAWFECTVYQTIDVGASTLVLGQVIGGELKNEAQPLVYFHRQWGTFRPVE